MNAVVGCGRFTANAIDFVLDRGDPPEDVPEEVKTAAQEGKKVAKELAMSMEFLERAVKHYIDEVDCHHVAEAVFEDGLKKEAELAKETAAAEAAKEKVRNHNAAKQQSPSGTVHRPSRWEPSQN